MKLMLLTLLSLMLCFPARVVSQQIHFDRMSIAEGLSSNSVYTIFQDRHGVLWFGTLDGLNRYDGYSITVYKHDNQKKQSISNNRVTHIYEDLQHHLWLYDEYSSSIIKYIRGKEEFTPYYLDKLTGAELRMLDSIYETEDKTLHVRSIDGYTLRYNGKQDRFEYIQRENVSTWHGKKEWANFLLAFDQFLLKSKSAFTSRTADIRKIIKDSEGRYWIATMFDGLYSATEQNGVFEFTSHLHTSEKFKHVNSEGIYDIHEDRSNVVWIGTKNSGLYRYSPHKYKFDHLEEVQLSTGPFQVGTVRAITEDADKTLWVGTNDQGLLRIDASHIKGKLYKPEPNNANAIAHRFIRSLWIDPDKNLWIGHYNGFSRYRKNTDNFISYQPKVESNEEIRVFDFKRGRNNTVWLAGWDLILHFDPATNRFKFISRKVSNETGFSSQNIRDIELDNEGDLWIAAGEKGISLYDKVKKRFSTLHNTPTDPGSLPSDNLFDVYKDTHQNIWLSTADGLCRFDPLKLTCETYTVNEGLPSNLVYGILEDKRGCLWFSTTKGIGKFDPQKKTFRNYDVSDGLQSNEFTENAFYQNDDGVMFFGGINGLNIFHPDRVPDNLHAPQVAITSFKVFDKPLSEVALFNEIDIRQKLADNEAIILAPEQRSISFEFVGRHYVNPQKNNYAYMLEAFDEGWTYRDANARFAHYTNLEPGTYFFRVMASNSDGLWSNYLRLKIIIEQPFYATTWFISISALLLIAIGVSAYRWRIAVVKKQQSMKSIQLESELNFLKSQVNPHFLFNTLNNIYALCQENSRNAAPMVGKISEMMRYMIYDCTADLVSLQKEFDYLKNYIDLNQLKSNRKLNASITIDGNLNGLKIAPLLLINFLENSFKHGDLNLNGDGFIKAHLAIHGPELFFSIKNSFRDKPSNQQEQQGIGLENVKHRLSLLYPGKHSLRVEKNNSIFEIQLKINLN